jgi:hypothetical protein
MFDKEVFDAHRWEDTPLGPRESWSHLRYMCDFIHGSRQPMFLLWGPERALIYNAAYQEIWRVPSLETMGRPIEEVAAEAWTVLKPLVDRGVCRGIVRPDRLSDIVACDRRTALHGLQLYPGAQLRDRQRRSAGWRVGAPAPRAASADADARFSVAAEIAPRRLAALAQPDRSVGRCTPAMGWASLPLDPPRLLPRRGFTRAASMLRRFGQPGLVS